MNVNASATRNVGSAMNVSINRASTRLPGNGVNAISTDSVKPRTRQPAVADSAIVSVFRTAWWNSPDATTDANFASDSGCASPPSAWRTINANGKRNSAARIRSGGAIQALTAGRSSATGSGSARSATNHRFRNQRRLCGAEIHLERRARRRRFVHRRARHAQHVTVDFELDALQIALPLDAAHRSAQRIAIVDGREMQVVRTHAQQAFAAVRQCVVIARHECAVTKAHPRHAGAGGHERAHGQKVRAPEKLGRKAVRRVAIKRLRVPERAELAITHDADV